MKIEIETETKHERERKKQHEEAWVSWIGFRASGVTRAKKRVTAVGCPCLSLD